MYVLVLTQITRSYYKGAAGCLLVYDVTERDTFEHLPTWLHDVREQAEENATIALVGNMADRPDTQRVVTHDEAAAFAQENKYVLWLTQPPLFRDECQDRRERRPSLPCCGKRDSCAIQG